MLPVLQVGPLAIQLPGLAIILGLWLGLILAERNAPRRGIHAATLYNLVFISLISGLLGARLLYVAQYPQAFTANPLNLISLNPGLLDLWGGVACAIMAALVYGQRKKLPLWSTLDALTPAFAIVSISMSIANLASGNAFGSPTSLPWGIELWGAVRHPTQIYETLLATMILLIIWRKGVESSMITPGLLFFIFLALTAGARLFLEAFRGDSYLVANGLRSAQLVAWLLLATGLTGIGLMKKEKQ
jgi:phosphatidylglycerol---prolipoprotein diacylglyceryl transferase